MKNREPRHNVLIPARLRWQRAWVPASLRNISSRGMMLRIANPPPAGTYVDIELANRVVTGRVVWSDGQACGFRLQDRFDVTSLRGGARGGAAALDSTAAAAPVAARRSTAETAEQSRRFSSMFQFGVLAAIAAIAAGLLASEAYHVISAPLDAVSAKLD